MRVYANNVSFFLLNVVIPEERQTMRCFTKTFFNRFILICVSLSGVEDLHNVKSPSTPLRMTNKAQKNSKLQSQNWNLEF